MRRRLCSKPDPGRATQRANSGRRSSPGRRSRPRRRSPRSVPGLGTDPGPSSSSAALRSTSSHVHAAAEACASSRSSPRRRRCVASSAASASRPTLLLGPRRGALRTGGAVGCDAPPARCRSRSRAIRGTRPPRASWVTCVSGPSESRRHGSGRGSLRPNLKVGTSGTSDIRSSPYCGSLGANGGVEGQRRPERHATGGGTEARVRRRWSRLASSTVPRRGRTSRRPMSRCFPKTTTRCTPPRSSRSGGGSKAGARGASYRAVGEGRLSSAPCLAATCGPRGIQSNCRDTIPGLRGRVTSRPSRLIRRGPLASRRSV